MWCFLCFAPHRTAGIHENPTWMSLRPVTGWDFIVLSWIRRLNKHMLPNGPRASLRVVRTEAALRDCWSAFELGLYDLVIGHSRRIITRIV